MFSKKSSNIPGTPPGEVLNKSRKKMSGSDEEESSRKGNDSVNIDSISGQELPPGLPASSEAGQKAQPFEIIPTGKETVPTHHPGDRVIRIRRPKLKGVRRVGPGMYEIISHPEPKSRTGRLLMILRRLLIGRPIRSEHEIQERLTKIKALGVFASDNISSSAYATEEIMRVLMLAGTATLALTMPLTISLIILLAVVTISYSQTIKAYPSGGGSYIVAMDNLGALPALVAGTALLTDYILTVAVSISAGVAAITSAFPALYPERVLICLAAILLLTIGNLRGIRESGSLFSAPVYIYLFSMMGALGYGIFRAVTGTLPSVPPPPSVLQSGGEMLGVFLLLRAFSSGAVALTGVEAVSNGIPAFKPPESRNAQITLLLMAGFFGAIFLGLSYLAIRIGIVPDPREIETVCSQLIRALSGTGWLYYLVQFSTSVLLLIAANTSFADFPRLSSIMARDKFLPRQFVFRGEKLAFNNGILILAALAGGLVVIFAGSVTNLIPLYTIGVFIAFTLSQLGMVVHWWRCREKGWLWSMIMNAIGCIATAAVALVVGITKFALGAWMVLVLIPILVLMLLGIRRHYQDVADQLVADLHNPEEHPDSIARQFFHYVVIPVSDLNIQTIRAIAYAKSLTGQADPAKEEEDNKRVIIHAVHVTDDLKEGTRLLKKWEQLNCGVPLSLIESPYRTFVEPFVRYLDAVKRQHRGSIPVITVLLPEFIPANWWEHFLHMQTSFWLKSRLLFRPMTVVTSVPHHLTFQKE